MAAIHSCDSCGDMIDGEPHRVSISPPFEKLCDYIRGKIEEMNTHINKDVCYNCDLKIRNLMGWTMKAED